MGGRRRGGGAKRQRQALSACAPTRTAVSGPSSGGGQDPKGAAPMSMRGMLGTACCASWTPILAWEDVMAAVLHQAPQSPGPPGYHCPTDSPWSCTHPSNAAVMHTCPSTHDAWHLCPN